MQTSKSKHIPQRAGLRAAIAVACSLLLVTGQAFACCHINESLASGLERWLSARSLHHAENQAQAADANSDAPCHEEGKKKEDKEKNREGISLGPQDHCISGSGLSAKPMVASESHLPALIPPNAPGAAKLALPPGFQFEKPRPPNKSSPPVYLTTRHLVV